MQEGAARPARSTDLWRPMRDGNSTSRLLAGLCLVSFYRIAEGYLGGRLPLMHSAGLSGRAGGCRGGQIQIGSRLGVCMRDVKASQGAKGGIWGAGGGLRLRLRRVGEALGMANKGVDVKEGLSGGEGELLFSLVVLFWSVFRVFVKSACSFP